MPFPGGGGDTRIKLISTGIMAVPRVGDTINAKLGKNITASGYTVLINRGSGFVTLTTVLPYTLVAADIPPIGGTWPTYVMASDLGLRSDTVNFTNPPRAPGAPTIGIAVPGNGQAGVQFNAPTDTGGSPITKYVVYAFSNGQLFGTQEATQSPVPFVGLTNGVPYSFRVLAVNSVGPGALSAFSNTVTPMPTVDFNGTPEATYSYIPTAVYGEQQMLGNTQFNLVRSVGGAASRYAPVPGSSIASTMTAVANDSTSGVQVIAEIDLPPLALTNSDTVTLTYMFSAPQTFGGNGTAAIRFVGNANGDLRKNMSNMSAGTSNGSTVTLSTVGTNALNARDNSGQYFFASGGTLRDINLFAPIKIQLIVNDVNAATPSGRTFTGSLSAVMNPSLPNPNAVGPFVDARDRPYSALSFWNIPLSVNAVLQTASDPETAAFRDRTGGQRFWRSESLRIFQTAPDDPLVSVNFNSRANASGYFEFKNTAVPGTVNLRFPPNVSVAESGGDNNLAVFSADGKIYREFYKYSFDEATGQRSCSVFTEHDLYGYGWPISWNRSNPVQTFSTGIRAGGGALLGGLVRKADFDRGYIDHAVVGILSLGKARKIPPFAVAQCTTSSGSPTVINTPGSGYALGNVLTLAGGTGRAAELTVTAVDANGGVTGVYVSNVGTYTAAPSGTLASTSNSGGTGATFTPSITANNSLSCRNWPATNVDSGVSNYTSVNGGWIGSLWTIPPSVDVTTLGLGAEAVMLALAIQRYGMYVMDTSDAVTNNILCYAGDVTQAQADLMAGYSGSPRFKCDYLEAIANVMVMVRNNTPQFPGGPGARGPSAPTVGPYPLY